MNKESLEEELNKVKAERDKYKELYETTLKELETLKANKKRAGRKNKLTEEERVLIRIYRCQGQTVKQLAESFKCSEGTVCNVLKE
ncbi:helix-turn-helix domain-containing protein [Clostridium baratii]|uniref:helix-turn-helix domain-containing protein n=1 Tax=Clostridium baratii TaxID=1561 RepID=UPI0030CA658D